MNKDPPNLPSEVRVIHDWPDVDRALLALRVTQAEMDTIGAQFDETIQQAQEAKQKALRSRQARVERMELEIEAFVRDHRDDMSGRTLKLTHGTVGFRKSPPKVEYSKGEEHTLEMLSVRGLTDSCVVVVNKLDKKALRKLSETEKALCGIKVLTEERFVLKLAKDPPVTYPEQAVEDDGEQGE